MSMAMFAEMQALKAQIAALSARVASLEAQAPKRQDTLSLNKPKAA